MSDNSSIEWTDATWNPVTGCSVVSPGCTNCYAMGLAGTRLRNHPSRAGLTIDTKAGPIWNGEVRLNEQWLTQPLKWKRPRTIFVCAHGDLFHENVPDEWIDRVFAVMALAPQHTFQVLTKRAKRMREYCSDPATPFRVAKAMDAIKPGEDAPEEIRAIAGYPGYFASSLGVIYTEHRGPRRPMKPDIGEQGHSRVQLHREGAGRYGDRHLVHRLILETFVGPSPSPEAQGRHRDGNARHNALHNLTWGTQEDNWTDAKRHGSHRRYSKLTADQADEIKRRHAAGETGESLAREFEISATQVRNIAAGRQWNVEPTIEWPLRNVWKGVSAEDQKRADERVPELLATPAAVRFVSAEPLLGPIDFARIERIPDRLDDKGSLKRAGIRINALTGHSCESGLPYQSLWNGEGAPPTTPPPCLDWIIVGGESGPSARPMHPDWPRAIRDQCAAAGVAFFFKQWGEWSALPPGEGEWPTDARTMIRLCKDGTKFKDGWPMQRVGKKFAGRLLDGRTHDEMPTRSA